MGSVASKQTPGLTLIGPPTLPCDRSGGRPRRPSDRSLMAGGRVKGTGRKLNRSFWSVLACNGLRGNDRHPKGRDAERLGCAAGAGERDPTSRRGPPKPSEISFTTYRKTSAYRTSPLVHCSDSVRKVRYLRQARLDASTPVRAPFLPATVVRLFHTQSRQV